MRGEYLRLCVSASSSTLTRTIENIQMRVVDFESDFRREGFAMSDEDAADLFSEGERSATAAKAD